MQRFFDHLHEIIAHGREHISWRRIFHVHGIVLGLAGWKVMLSHIGLTFLGAKLAFVQVAAIKLLIGFGLFTLFPVGDAILATTQEVKVGYCGNTVIQGHETCDDGNAKEGDGCDRRCQTEPELLVTGKTSKPIPKPAPFGIDIAPVLQEQMLRSIQTFQQACRAQPQDTTFLVVLADTIEEDGSIDPLHLLASYCVTDHYDRARYGQLPTTIAVTKADAIKMFAKIHALDRPEVYFDENNLHVGPLPYANIAHDGWYIDYLLYLDENGLLEGIGTQNMKGEKSLDILMPVTKQELKVLLRNFDAERYYPLLESSGTYVYRGEFAALLVDAFAEKFADYVYLRGGNLSFYQKFLKQLEGKSPELQWSYLQTLSRRFEKNDPMELITQQNLYADGVEAFLKEVVLKAKK